MHVLRVFECGAVLVAWLPQEAGQKWHSPLGKLPQRHAPHLQVSHEHSKPCHEPAQRDLALNPLCSGVLPGCAACCAQAHTCCTSTRALVRLWRGYATQCNRCKPTRTALAPTRLCSDLLCLHMAQVPHELIHAMPGSKKNGGTKSPEFLVKFPNGTVPSIDDQGFCLSEATAVLRCARIRMPSLDNAPVTRDAQE